MFNCTKLVFRFALSCALDGQWLVEVMRTTDRPKVFFAFGGRNLSITLQQDSVPDAPTTYEILLAESTRSS